MCKIIQFDEIKRGSMRTKDGKSQRWLWNKTAQIIADRNTTKCPNEEILDYIKKSFSYDGMVEIYNMHGYAIWYSVVAGMIDHEIRERKEVV